MADPIEWLSTDKAAKYLGITNRTLYRLIDAGEVPAYKFGRVIRLKQSDINAFIEAAKVQPGSLKHLYPDPRAGGDDGDGAAPEGAAEATGGEDGLRRSRRAGS